MSDKRRKFDDFGDVMTVSDLAEVLEVSQNFLRERIRRNEVPGVRRLGRRILILKKAFLHAMTEEEQK